MHCAVLQTNLTLSPCAWPQFILRQIWWVLTCGGKLNCKRRRSVASLASLEKWIEYPNRQWLPPFTDGALPSRGKVWWRKVARVSP